MNRNKRYYIKNKNIEGTLARPPMFLCGVPTVKPIMFRGRYSGPNYNNFGLPQTQLLSSISSYFRKKAQLIQLIQLFRDTTDLKITKTHNFTQLYSLIDLPHPP